MKPNDTSPNKKDDLEGEHKEEGVEMDKSGVILAKDSTAYRRAAGFSRIGLSQAGSNAAVTEGADGVNDNAEI